MLVSVSLALAGTTEEPCWVASLQRGRDGYRNCCEAGHGTPEEAASHGGALAATWLSRYARSLKSPACGALAIQKLEVA
jgi:hypothetical protein